MSRTLIAYFSATGTTKRVAHRLADLTQADLFEIVPADPYTANDLNWHDRTSRTSLEAQDPSIRPNIAKRVPNFESYDTIALGFPIWWYTAPAIIWSFLEAYDFSHTKIALFATSGGSGMGSIARDVAQQISVAAILADKVLHATHSSELQIFAEKLCVEHRGVSEHI